MSTLMPLRGALPLLSVLAVAASARAEVWTVDASGGADFTQINQAVAAAMDGDTILVRTGNYLSVPILDKAITIVAEEDEIVSIQGYLGVVDLAAGKTVLISGVRVNQSGLFVNDCAGAVRAQGCVFKANSGSPVRVYHSRDVGLTSCVMEAADGVGGSVGGSGTFIKGSTVAMFDCDSFGGDGGDSQYEAGEGGRGISLVGSTLTMVGGRAKGGNGGDSDDFIVQYCSSGGAGIRLAPNSFAYLVDTQLQGGLGGHGLGNCTGPHGPGLSGAVANATFLAGTEHVLDGSPVVREGEQVTLQFRGTPGSQIHLAKAASTGFKFDAALSGAWLLHYPPLVTVEPIGVIPQQGPLVVTIPVNEIGAGLQSRTRWFQPFVITPAGDAMVGNPVAVVLLDAAF